MTVDREEQCVEVARQTLEEIAASSEPLRSTLLVQPDPQLALSLAFEVQPGLGFPVSANLQNVDELHLNVGEVFWCEWFPCSDPVVRLEFRQAMQGVLSGEYRVVEFYRKDRAIKAELERPQNGTWTRVARYSTLRLPSFVRPKTRILQNVRAGE